MRAESYTHAEPRVLKDGIGIWGTGLGDVNLPKRPVRILLIVADPPRIEIVRVAWDENGFV